MKTIENKSLSDSTGEYKYSQIIANRVKLTPPGGFNDLGEMKTRLKVLDVLENSTDNIDFEDADFALVKAVMSPSYAGWPAVTKELVELLDIFA